MDPEALPGYTEEALGHLPYRFAYVLDETVAAACVAPMERAGYQHATSLIMAHHGPVPEHGGAREVDFDELRGPVTASWPRFAPQAPPEHIRDLVERRVARRRGAEVVRFFAVHTPEGEVAAWADLYMDPAEGVAQIEDLVTVEAHLGQGYRGTGAGHGTPRGRGGGLHDPLPHRVRGRLAAPLVRPEGVRDRRRAMARFERV
ncbi:GNAT family N-acetyltransferase [Streptomyces tanashiensis]